MMTKLFNREDESRREVSISNFVEYQVNLRSFFQTTPSGSNWRQFLRFKTIIIDNSALLCTYQEHIRI